MNFKNKKGVFPGMGLLIGILAIVGLVSLVFFFAGMSDKGSGLQVERTEQAQAAQPGNAVTDKITFTEDVTVTLSSFDMFSLGTSAGTAHRILQLDGTTSSVVADDSTLEKSPGNQFVVLLGNVTDATDFTPGTTYYPKLVSGTLPDDGTYTIGCNPSSPTCASSNAGGQALSAGKSQLTFTFTNEDGTANSAQALGANDADTKVKWKITVNDNVCVGNPDASKQSGKQNIASYRYNTTVLTTVKQLDANGNDQTAVTTPTGVNISNGFAVKSYEFPVVCDNNFLERTVRLATGATEPDGNHDINLTFSDISWYVNDDSLEPIADYEDEDNNNQGVDDYIPGSLILS